jgi:hypothetical protein
MTEFDYHIGEPLPSVSARYLSLVKTLLGRELESEDHAPLPEITVRNVDDPIERLPGDLSKDAEQAIRAKLFRALDKLPPNWEALGETERVPWLEAAIEKRAGGTPEGETKGKVKSGDEDNWILVSDALTELPFLRNRKALYKFAKENPGKLRLRSHPSHKQRRQANAGDVLRLAKEYNNKQFAAMDGSGADSLPSLTEESLAPLAERLTRERAEKHKK